MTRPAQITQLALTAALLWSVYKWHEASEAVLTCEVSTIVMEMGRMNDRMLEETERARGTVENYYRHLPVSLAPRIR